VEHQQLSLPGQDDVPQSELLGGNNFHHITIAEKGNHAASPGSAPHNPALAQTLPPKIFFKIH
jgi:hypothetical protein